MTFKQDAREAKKLRVPRSTDFSNIGDILSKSPEW